MNTCAPPVPLPARFEPVARAGTVVGHLYVHVPFCHKICPYCSFFKEKAQTGLMQAYVDALLREAEIQAARFPLRPRTVFIGGGTPTALGLGALRRLLEGLARRIDLTQVEEFTVEMNPATVTPAKAELLLERGVNRISMGVQSWEPGELELLGRLHTAEQAAESFVVLRKAGFTNVNLDLMFAVPGQSAGSLSRNIQRTAELAPEHISAYCLTYEEHTDFFVQLARGALVQDEEWEAALFEQAWRELESFGYSAYEISNFSRHGRECRHNLAYWHGADYLGLGPSAWSTIGDRRWRNVASTPRYAEMVSGGKWKPDEEERLDAATRIVEQAAFRLRTRNGVPKEMVKGKAGPLGDLVEEGLLEQTAEFYRLTPRGRLLADEIALLLV